MYAFDVDEIKVEANLQQFKNGSWVTIKSWTLTSVKDYCILMKSWYVPKGYGYRLVSTGTVYIGGKQVESAQYKSRVIYYE